MYAKVFFIFRSFLSTPVRAFRPVFCLAPGRGKTGKGKLKNAGLPRPQYNCSGGSQTLPVKEF